MAIEPDHGLQHVVYQGGFFHFLFNILIAVVSFGLLYYSRKTGNHQLCYLVTVVCVFMILFPAVFFNSTATAAACLLSSCLP